MTIFYPPVLCAEVEGLVCLSDIPNLEQQLLCSSEDPCLHFFQGMGFRPAVRAVERDQYGDRMILIVSDDEAYFTKYDMPFDAMAFLPSVGSLLSSPVAPIQPLLATPGGAPATYASSGFPGFGGFPSFGGGGGNVARPSVGSTAPGQPPTVTPPSDGIPGGGTSIGGGGGGTEELPPLTPIPLSGSGLFLVIALAMMIVTAARRLPRPSIRTH